MAQRAARAALCETLKALTDRALLAVLSEGAFQVVAEETCRQAGPCACLKSKAARCEDFAKSMESGTCGVQKSPHQCFITDVSVSY